MCNGNHVRNPLYPSYNEPACTLARSCISAADGMTCIIREHRRAIRDSAWFDQDRATRSPSAVLLLVLALTKTGGV
jgi:hypothetical protein